MAEPSVFKYCATCGYLIEELPERRCPECGTGFDPSNPKTFLTGCRIGLQFDRGTWCLFVACIGFVLINGALTTIPGSRGPDFPDYRWIRDLLVTIGLAIEALMCLAGLFLLGIRRRVYGRRMHAGIWLAGLTVMGALVFKLWVYIMWSI